MEDIELQNIEICPNCCVVKSKKDTCAVCRMFEQMQVVFKTLQQKATVNTPEY